MRNTFRLGPWLCETGFHRWCPCLYNLLLTELHRWLVLFEMTVGNAEWLFSLQIKYPLYSAHSSARGYTVPLATGCHAEKKLRLGPSGFATPVFTGCAFVCTCIPLRKSCTEFDDLFCRQTRRTAYTALCPSRTEILRILFFSIP